MWTRPTRWLLLAATTTPGRSGGASGTALPGRSPAATATPSAASPTIQPLDDGTAQRHAAGAAGVRSVALRPPPLAFQQPRRHPQGTTPTGNPLLRQGALPPPPPPPAEGNAVRAAVAAAQRNQRQQSLLAESARAAPPSPPPRHRHQQEEEEEPRAAPPPPSTAAPSPASNGQHPAAVQATGTLPASLPVARNAPEEEAAAAATAVGGAPSSSATWRGIAGTPLAAGCMAADATALQALLKHPAGAAAAREAAQLSTEQLVRRLQPFSRHRRPSPGDAPVLAAILAELAAHRAPLLAPKVLRDVLLVAHAAGHHTQALDLFYARCVTHAHELEFSLIDTIVDCAYALGAPGHLHRLAAIGATKMRNVPFEVLSDVALSRLLWRVACVAVEGRLSVAPSPPEEQRPAPSPQAPAATPPTARQQGASDSTKRRNAVRPLAARAASSLEAGARLFRAVWADALVPIHPAMAAKDPDAVYRALCRRVRYGSGAGGDRGEMHAFLYFKQQGVLRSSTVDLVTRERQVILHVALIRSCRAGSWVSQAEEYFAAATPGAGAGDGGAAAGVEEQVVYGYFAILHAAKEHLRLARTGGDILARNPAALSPGIVAMIATSAGEAGLPAVAIAAYDALVRQRDADPDVTPFVVHQLLSALGKAAVPDFRTRLQECVTKGLASAFTPESTAFLLLQHALHSATVPDDVAAIVAEMEAAGVAFSERIYSQLLLVYLRLESPRMLPTFKKAVDVSGFFRANWLEHLVVWADRRRYTLTPEERRYVVQTLRARGGLSSPPPQGGSLLDAAVQLVRGGPLDAGGLRPALVLLLHDEANDNARRRRAGSVVGGSGNGAGAAASSDPHVANDPLPAPLQDPRAYFLRRVRPSVAVGFRPMVVVGAVGAQAAEYAPLQRLLPPCRCGDHQQGVTGSGEKGRDRGQSEDEEAALPVAATHTMDAIVDAVHSMPDGPAGGPPPIILNGSAAPLSSSLPSPRQLRFVELYVMDVLRQMEQHAPAAGGSATTTTAAPRRLFGANHPAPFYGSIL